MKSDFTLVSQNRNAGLYLSVMKVSTSKNTNKNVKKYPFVKRMNTSNKQPILAIKHPLVKIITISKCLKKSVYGYLSVWKDCTSHQPHIHASVFHNAKRRSISTFQKKSVSPCQFARNHNT